MKKLLAGFAFVATICLASPLSHHASRPAEPSAAASNADKKSPTLQGAVLRAATRIIYNAGAIDTDKAIAPQALAAISTPEPNANFLIGSGLLGVAYLLQRKAKRSK